MIENIENLVIASANFLWGPPMLILLSFVGIFYTIVLKGLQFRKFVQAAKNTLISRTSSGEGNITPLQSLFSALGGLIGNGNLAGVATAIAMGGPGSIFWMWVGSFIGMIIVYAETLLALKNRDVSQDGIYSGGPMYYIEKRLKVKWLAVLFAFAMGFKTLFATTTIQSNSIALTINSTLGIPLLWICLGLAILTWLVIIGGLRSIAITLEKLTPSMVIIYFIVGISIILGNIDKLVYVFQLIIESAFTIKGASGGFAGATVMMAIRYGVARGFYSNEAGTGSSPIMYSTAKTDDPVRQSLIGMFGVFIDTLVGTLTAFIILITGVWDSGLTSTALTTEAFVSFYGFWGGYIMLFSSFLFGFSTLIAWSFYGEQCFAYIWGDKVRVYVRWVFCTSIGFGFLSAESLWSMGDLLNAVTIIINLIAVTLLIKYVVSDSKSLFKNNGNQ